MVRRSFIVCLLAGLLPLFCQAQNSQDPAASKAPEVSGSASPAAQASSAAAPEKTKKVWTNEEMGSLKGTISVVGDKTASKTNSPTDKKQGNAKSVSHEAAVRRYRDEIAQLKTQIGVADARISQLKNFKADNAAPSGGLELHKGYTMLPPEEQIKQLEAKKKQLQAKIDDLELQAEKEGIDPGELR